MSITFRSRHPARGFAAIAAVFLVVVLGGLGAVLATVFTAQQRGAAFDTLGTYAYQAARAGIEYGAYQALQGTPVCSAAPVTVTFTGTVLTDFTASVTCTPINHEEGGATVVTYEIKSTACNRTSCADTTAPDATYVERQLRATVVSAAPTA